MLFVIGTTGAIPRPACGELTRDEGPWDETPLGTVS